MHLRDYIHPSQTFASLRPSDKNELLRMLAKQTAGQLPDVDENVLLNRLVARELESSTGVGQGVAIPHCFLNGLKQSYCILAQVPQGIDYEALDEKPVYILFMLMSPPDNRMSHLRLLARISRVANRDGFAKEAAAATTADELYHFIVDEDRSHAG